MASTGATSGHVRRRAAWACLSAAALLISANGRASARTPSEASDRAGTNAVESFPVGALAPPEDSVDVPPEDSLDFADEMARDYGIDVDVAQARLAQQALMPQFVDEVRTLLGESFAGVKRDIPTGSVEVYSTKPVDQEVLAKELPDVKAPVTLIVVQRSESELLAEGQRLFDGLSTSVDPNSFSFSGDPRTGRFTLTVERSVSESVDERLSSGVIQVDTSAVDIVLVDDVGGDDACSRTACDPPLRGGLRIIETAGYGCSTGFNVQLSSGSKYVLTSGHCRSSTWKHNGTVIGPSGLRIDSGFVDAQRIKINSTSVWSPLGIVRRVSDPDYPIYGRTTYNQIYADQYVCRYGGYSDDCGEVLSKIASSGNNYPLIDVYDMCANAGDSGGSVIDPGNNFATGMHVASSGGDICPGGFEVSFFSSISEIEQELGATILTK